ncbi:MAG: DUF72 domain-containing protein [Candidatus Lokiarchaeota archaeon]|nr:DUF72 domain-containing protein [Candidatus Lokiarchaeota archaeon]
MVKITIGTAGFSYKDWVGPFYPKKLQRSRHLEFFSNYFPIVEINSTFYNIPSEDMVINWNNRVPEEFRFIVKLWQKITHELKSSEIDNRILEFFSRVRPLKEKIFGILLQFPPWFNYSEKHLKQLNYLIEAIPSEYNCIIELRDNSWFNPEIISNFIEGKNIILGTTYMPGIIPYYKPNQNYYYIRLIGDRELTVFNRIQRSQKETMKNLFKNVQNLLKKPDIYEIFIIVNNHFQGHAPESVNIIKQKFGLSYHSFGNQKSLTDFIP